MVFGDLEQAFRAARAVHGIHRRIVGKIPSRAGALPAGTAYHANEPEALLWVHATLWDTSVLCYEAVRRPLREEEKAAYYEETKRFAYLFAIPDSVLPADWKAFRAYMDDMLGGELLTVTPCAAEMARFLFRPPAPGLGPLMRWYEGYTAGLLPARLARGFGLPPASAARRRIDGQVVRALFARLPRRLRYLPAYVEARRRLAGRTDRDYVGELLSRAMTGGQRR